MAFTITIDRLDANIEEITLGPWLKREGDPVALGEPVVEIITDKITFEYESEAAGILRKIVAPEKSVVPVHYVIGVIAEEDEALPDYEKTNAELHASLAEQGGLAPAARTPRIADASRGVRAVASQASRPAQDRSGGRIRATPAARRRAKELGLDLADVAATVDGAVSLEDVERFAQT